MVVARGRWGTVIVIIYMFNVGDQTRATAIPFYVESPADIPAEAHSVRTWDTDYAGYSGEGPDAEPYSYERSRYVRAVRRLRAIHNTQEN